MEGTNERNPSFTESLTQISETNISQQYFQKQMKILSSFYIMRIQLQRIISFVNRLPLNQSMFSDPRHKPFCDALLKLFNGFLRLHTSIVNKSTILSENDRLKFISLERKFIDDADHPQIERSSPKERSFFFYSANDQIHTYLRSQLMTELDKAHKAVNIQCFRVLNALPSLQIERTLKTKLPELIVKASLSSNNMMEQSTQKFFRSEMVENVENSACHYYYDISLYTSLVKHASTHVSIFTGYSNSDADASTLLSDLHPNKKNRKACHGQRASKERLISFKPITKLLGFMQPLENNVPKDQSLENLFVESIFNFG